MPNPVELRLTAFGADSTHVPSRSFDPAMIGRLKSLGLLGADDLPLYDMFVVQHPQCKELRDLRQKPIHLIHVGGVERVVLRSIIVDVTVSKDGSTIDLWADGDRKTVGLWLFRCDRRPRQSAVFLKRFKDAGVACEFMRLPSGFVPPVTESLAPPIAPPTPAPAPPPRPAPAPVAPPVVIVTAPAPPPVEKPAPKVAEKAKTVSRPPAAPAPPVQSKVKPAAEKAPPKPRRGRSKPVAVEETPTVPPPPDIVEALVVPVGKVRPFAPSLDPRFPGQPRVWFDPDKLKKLALSIQKYGQRTPIMAKRLTPPEDGFEFELIDGERRWRALTMINATHVAITVSRPRSKAEQHMASLIQNFCREGHTHMETSNAIASQVEVGE